MKLDIGIFNFFHGFAGKAAVFDMLVIFGAKILPYFLVLVFLIFVLRFKGSARQKVFIFCFSALALIFARGIITELVRFLYFRDRPFAALNFKPLFLNTEAAFPSGHTAFFFALAFATFLFNRKLGIWLSVFALAVGLSRVVAGVHWPSDILGGLAVALVSVTGLWFLMRRYWKGLGR